MAKRKQRSNSPLHNVEHLSRRLQGAEMHQALLNILATPAELLDWYKPLIPQLLKLGHGLAERAACLIGPESEEDFNRLLASVHESGGSSTPSAVTLLEQSGPCFENSIEAIAGLLRHPHYRIRIATARCLASMGNILELIEDELLLALQDKSLSVVAEVVRALKENETDLSDALGGALDSAPVEPLRAEQQAAFDKLERRLWWPRSERLNSSDQEEDVIFVVHNLSGEQKQLPSEDLINRLLGAHGLPERAKSFKPTNSESFHWTLRDALKPVYFTTPCVSEPTEILAEELRGLFHPDAQLLSNHQYHQYDQSGQVSSWGVVTSNIVDDGVICLDQERIGLFFVTDAD